jgi:hypothetical protein
MRDGTRPAALRFLAIGAIAGVLPGCGLGPTPKAYTDQMGNFRVLLVGTPKKTQRPVPSPAGPILMLGVESVDGDQTTRAVLYNDYPMQIVQFGDPDAMLDGAVHGMTSTNWSVQSQTTIKLDGHPGREVSFEVNSPTAPEKGIGKARMYLVGKRLYQTIIVGRSSKVTQEELDNFLGSFALLRIVPIATKSTAPAAAGPSGGDIARARGPGMRRRPGAPKGANRPPAGTAGRAAGASPPATTPGTPNNAVMQGEHVGPDPSQPAEVAIEAAAPPVSRASRPQPDGNERERFRDEASERGVLVGVRVGYIDAFGGKKIGAIQPIYQAGSTYVDGLRYGKDIPTPVTLVAKPGYVVGALNTKTGLLLDAFQVTFVKFNDGRLDMNDSYTSDWLGDPRGGNPATTTSAGKLVVGIHGRTTGREVNALGLVVAD